MAEDDEFIELEFEDDDEFVEYLIEMCILEEEGFDENGEVLYVYNFEKMMTLFEEGLVTVEYDENLIAHFSATPEGMEFFNRKYHSQDE
jgi:hypothetical protein